MRQARARMQVRTQICASANACRLATCPRPGSHTSGYSLNTRLSRCILLIFLSLPRQWAASARVCEEWRCCRWLAATPGPRERREVNGTERGGAPTTVVWSPAVVRVVPRAQCVLLRFAWYRKESLHTLRPTRHRHRSSALHPFYTTLLAISLTCKPCDGPPAARPHHPISPLSYRGQSSRLTATTPPHS